MNKFKAIIFDWGDTVMRDFPEYKGPMVYWPRVEMMEGIDTALKYLHKDYTCCLASNAGDSGAELMGLALSRVNLRQYFDYLFTSREFGVKKPDPAFYLELVKNIGFDLEQCIVVGNDYEKDIMPAKPLGISTIWFSQDLDSTLFPYADYSIDSLDKLIPVIEKLSQIDHSLPSFASFVPDVLYLLLWIRLTLLLTAR